MSTVIQQGVLLTVAPRELQAVRVGIVSNRAQLRT